MTAMLSASTLAGDKVTNANGEDLGKVEELILTWKAAGSPYAVLSLGPGFLQSGKMFAIPWASLAVDEANKQ